VAELAVITASMAVALPVALALQPQEMTIAVTELEPRFHDITDADGQPVTHVYAQKGL
jgi:hypothetical protein